MTRQEDRRVREGFAAALQDSADAAKPEQSMAHLAAALTAGVDDPHPVGLASLYKMCEGSRAFPAHKLVALCEATGSDAALRYLAGAAGYLLVRKPKGQVTINALCRMVQEHGEAVATTCAAMDEASEDGRAITRAELARIEKELAESMEATGALLEECRRLAS